MKPSLALASNRDAIRRVVAAHRASNPRVFGSVAHGDDTEESDLDILIDPTLSLIHISEPTRLRRISYAVFCL